VSDAQIGQGVTGLILAGGRSRRFGSDKAWAELEGRPLLQWVGEALAAVCSELVVVRAKGQALPAVAVPVPVRCVEDEFEAFGPLAGLVSGFLHVRTEYCVSAAVDVPLLQPGVVRRLAERAVGHDVAVPRIRGFAEPLAAAYRATTCLARFRASLLGGNRKIQAAYAGMDVVYVDEDDIRDVDADLRSFENANYPESIEELARILSGSVASTAPGEPG
jgi:molybdopterin-guanine dinucleotide biosynthesis protein A